MSIRQMSTSNSKCSNSVSIGSWIEWRSRTYIANTATWLTVWLKAKVEPTHHQYQLACSVRTPASHYVLVSWLSCRHWKLSSNENSRFAEIFSAFWARQVTHQLHRRGIFDVAAVLERVDSRTRIDQWSGAKPVGLTKVRDFIYYLLLLIFFLVEND